MGKIIISVFLVSLIFFSLPVFGAENESVLGNSSFGSYEYTINFYMALIFGFVGFLIIIILIISFIKSPRNKWKR